MQTTNQEIAASIMDPKAGDWHAMAHQALIGLLDVTRGSLAEVKKAFKNDNIDTLIAKADQQTQKLFESQRKGAAIHAILLKALRLG